MGYTVYDDSMKINGYLCRDIFLYNSSDRYPPLILMACINCRYKAYNRIKNA